MAFPLNVSFRVVVEDFCELFRTRSGRRKMVSPLNVSFRANLSFRVAFGRFWFRVAFARRKMAFRLNVAALCDF